MAQLIPKCPNCHDSKVVLAPIPPNVNDKGKIECGELPVACTQCMWRGIWRDVVYVSV